MGEVTRSDCLPKSVSMGGRERSSARAPLQNKAKSGETIRRRSSKENREAWEEMIAASRSIMALIASAGVAGFIGANGVV